VGGALDRLLRHGPRAWTGLSRGQQLALLGLLMLLPAALVFGTPWLGDGPYVPLFAALPAEDAGAIVAQLRAAKVPYRVGPAGDVLVPAGRAAELRLSMAAQGLPLGGGVGFEVFDRSALGMSDFAQRLNYQRALQGELARTISQLRPVARARVHLVLPQPSVFTERERPASASVFLRLHPGGRLSADQVRGIVHLVASSVEGLLPERVTVVDTAGRVLSVGGDTGTSQLSPRRLEIKAAVEDGLQQRVQSLLDAALGPGQAVIRVAAQLNFDQVERTEERFDPNAVVRQETRTVERSKASTTTPSVQAVPPGPASAAAPPLPAATTTNDGNRETENVQYEISKIVARTLTTPGEIQRLSVAVLLNTGTKTVPAGEGRPETREPQPRSAEELEKIRKIVMGAVGYTASRGDEVTVVEMPFDTALLDRERAALEGPAPAAPLRDLITNQVVALAAVLLLGGLAFVWLLRQQSRRRGLAEVTRSLEEQEARAASSGGPSDGRAVAPDTELDELPGVPEELLRMTKKQEDLRQQATTLASTEPQAAAQLIRAWLVKKKSLQAAGGRDAG
jgi:flagellar M-ring protein FliF